MRTAKKRNPQDHYLPITLEEFEALKVHLKPLIQEGKKVIRSADPARCELFFKTYPFLGMNKNRDAKPYLQLHIAELLFHVRRSSCLRSLPVKWDRWNLCSANWCGTCLQEAILEGAFSGVFRPISRSTKRLYENVKGVVLSLSCRVSSPRQMAFLLKASGLRSDGDIGKFLVRQDDRPRPEINFRRLSLDLYRQRLPVEPAPPPPSIAPVFGH